MNRYIQIRLKSVQRLLGKIMNLDFVKPEKNITDTLTKGLSRSVVLESSREMGLNPSRVHRQRELNQLDWELIP